MQLSENLQLNQQHLMKIPSKLQHIVEHMMAVSTQL